MLNSQIGATKSWNGQYTVPCEKVPSLPDLTFHFAGKKYPLKGTDYILEVQGTCMSAFTGLDINLPDGGSIWIVGASILLSVNVSRLINCCAGDVFLRRYYTIYDLEKNAVGFADAA